MPAPDVLVVGSINYDLFLSQDRRAAKGETYSARGVREAFGGKGANQAAQCAKLGTNVAFLGAVGTDERGAACVKNLQSLGIDCHIRTVADATGLGVVNVLPDGEVHATIVEGANGSVDEGLIAANADLFQGVAYVVLQNEIPESGLRAAVQAARNAGATIVYNAAPARPWARGIAANSDYLIVNEEEAQEVAGRRVTTVEEMRSLVPDLRHLCPHVVITLGSHGSLISDGEAVEHIPATPVTAVDTTGAGDSFVGAFVTGLMAGHDERTAAKLASKVAAKTTTGFGAQTSMPDRW